MPASHPLKEIAALFLKLGIIGFGGPAAHIAMMRDEVVKKRQWLTDERFLDLVGATNLIPGPNSTELAIHIGKERGGWKGLLLAGACFILPAVLLTLLLAWLYTKYGNLPHVQPFIYGTKPAIIAIIIAAIIPLAKKSLKSIWLWIIGLAAVAAGLAGINEIFILFGAGLLALVVSSVSNEVTRSFFPLLPFTLLQETGNFILSTTNAKLFLIFLKIGAILYGSGYVLFAFLDTELVETGMITRMQLTDAISAGQITPGPVFSSVTFVGYLVNGFSGAAISTLAIFLPSFIFVAALNPLVSMMRRSTLFAHFLDAVNVASVALVLVVCYELGRESIIDWRTMLIAVASLVVVFVFRKTNSAFIILGGALLGYLLYNF